MSDIGSGNVDMFSLQEINELYACDTSISLYMYDTSLKTKKNYMPMEKSPESESKQKFPEP